MQLSQVNAQIAQQRGAIGVLETEWQHVASPERIQQLAQAKLAWPTAPRCSFPPSINGRAVAPSR